jgi:DNA modification methylase
VKPVALIADALLDCYSWGDIVLDSFLGSDSTLLAAERIDSSVRPSTSSLRRSEERRIFEIFYEIERAS